MGFVTVGQAVADYMTAGMVENGGPIPDLSTVYQTPPMITPEWEFYKDQNPGHMTGAVMYVHISHRISTRIAVGGQHSGKKMRVYNCYLLSVYRSQEDRAEDAGMANRIYLDAVNDWIEADRNLGAPAVIWQAGEGNLHGGEDLSFEIPMPRILGNGTKQIWNILEMYAIEEATT